jgi:very-short-patch-repair endonuclease
VHPVDLVVTQLAERQYRLFSRAQVLAGGGDDALIRRRCHAGRWMKAGPGVYSLPGSPSSYLRSLWRAHLAAGPHSTVSHESAAALEDFTSFPRKPIVLTVPHPLHPRVDRATIHQISDLEQRWIWRLGDLPVTVPARTFVDIAPFCSKARLEVALDDALLAGRASQAAIARCLFDVLRPGKLGLEKLILLLEARGPGYVPPASELERLLFGALRDLGLDAPVRQFPLPGRGAIDGLVDAAYIDAKLILEADGRRWHTRMRDFPRDALRRNEAARAGWQTLDFLWDELKFDPVSVAQTVSDVLALRTSRQ